MVKFVETLEMKYCLLFLATWLVACNQNAEVAPAYQPPMLDAAAKMSTDAGMPVPAYEIKRIDLQVRVSNLEEAESWVKQQLAVHKGKVTGNSSYNEGHSRSTQLMLQIPVKELDNWVKALEAQSDWRVQGKHLSATSIEQQYVDNAQRLKTRQALEQRYIELLQQAKSMADVLAIEEKLVTIRSEIEWMQTEKNRMDDQISYAECSLRLEERLSAWQRLTREALNQWREGWYVLVQFVLFLLRIWPLLLIGSVLVWWFRRRKRMAA